MRFDELEKSETTIVSFWFSVGFLSIDSDHETAINFILITNVEKYNFLDMIYMLGSLCGLS